MNITPLTKTRLALPIDFIRRPTCLARVERLIAATDGFARVVVDFQTKRTTIEYPAPVLHSGPYPLIVLK